MNEQFLKQMQQLLGDEYPAYLEALQKDARRAFRLNLLKTNAEEFFQNFDIAHERSPFASNGYYTDDSKYGSTPEYMAGAFYMQEASASSAVTILDPQPGMKILDMCAAPGSKTTQILEKMNHEGLLVSNEIDPKRASVLLENVERNGAANCIVLNSDTNKLPTVFPLYFDMVLADAPCSGEGMMRKNEEAVLQWNPQLVSHCASLQKEILENAYACLKEDGILVYSTCTLNTEENEKQVLQFLEKHPDMEMSDPHVSFGRKAFLKEKDIDLAVRIFPMDGGEGHFIAKMHKKGSPSVSKMKELKSDIIPREVKDLLQETIQKQYPYYYLKNNRLYGGTYPFIDTSDLHLLRNQVYIGEIKKGRFEFSHHFFMSAYSSFKNVYEMNDEEVKRYMHGEQLSGIVQKGWYAMCYHNYVVGTAKSDGKAFKNKYPKAFRTR